MLEILFDCVEGIFHEVQAQAIFSIKFTLQDFHEIISYGYDPIYESKSLSRKIAL
jgi:hypothetical protein